MTSKSIFIGYDPRETQAYAVAVYSARLHMWRNQIPVRGLVLSELTEIGLYHRPMERTTREDGSPVLIDKMSMRADYSGAMSTEFAISRFCTPLLAKTGWALFMDCDVLVRADLNNLFNQLDPTKALMCVKHNHASTVTTKMDGQPQTNYTRKNWSSVMAFNCDHPANKKLTPALINAAPGRELHNFFWLKDDDIGALDPAWNWLAGEQPPIDNPFIVHHTLGSPCLKGYEDAPYADEWRLRLAQWGASP